ncbi:MAG: CAAX prenyl protease-related protein [Terrimicrobiaceae bacterium]|nr:CAAX prenyl protease-related protein [Terrimicrobiaceae bacterium]
MTPRKALAAYCAPFAAFLGFLALAQFLESLGVGRGDGLLREPKYWVYPLQTVVCAGLLAWFWRHFEWRVRGWWLATAAGLLVFALWVSPQAVFGRPPRLEGFNPSLFETQHTIYWLTLGMRWLRLVVVVPLVEEIFWRGFLMRYLINENFLRVKFGAYSHLSFFAVAVAFMLVHVPEDWPAALLTGLIIGGVAVRTGSLFACVWAHAVANAALGAYILSTRQWGFW